MRQQLLLSVFALITLFNLSCKKSDDATPYVCQTCKKIPDALAANDAISKGIYKGVIIGSSGTVMFDILNSGTTITATLVLDGVTTTLTSNVSWTAGAPYIGSFTGTLSGNPVSISFSVNANGTSPTVIAYNIPGHPNASFTIVKETSQNLVECFEGTYNTSKPESGVFNVVLGRSISLWGGATRKLTGGGTQSTTNINGTISSDSSLYQTVSNGSIKIGSLYGHEMSGSFVDPSDNSTVTFYGKRSW